MNKTTMVLVGVLVLAIFILIGLLGHLYNLNLVLFWAIMATMGITNGLLLVIVVIIIVIDRRD